MGLRFGAIELGSLRSGEWLVLVVGADGLEPPTLSV
jgi:hypothetical protein